MKNTLLLIFTTVIFSTVCLAQDDKAGGKKSVKETLQDLPEMLIAQPQQGPDTNANKLINDNLSIVINPIWREKGLHTLTEFKLNKIHEEPLATTFPLPDKKRMQTLVITMGTPKKSPADKKLDVENVIRKHIAAYYKAAGLSTASATVNEQVKKAIISEEKFTTKQGKAGELTVYHDVETGQSNYIVLFTTVSDKNPASTHFIQFTYTRFTYETEYPEDIAEWRPFLYPDEEKLYLDFTKNILSTFYIK